MLKIGSGAGVPTHPVAFVLMAYQNTLQDDALKLKKLRRSLAVEGEIPEEGLAAYDDHGDDLMLVLARRAGSSESVFA